MSSKANTAIKRARQLERDNAVAHKTMIEFAMRVSFTLHEIDTIEEAREWADAWYRELTS